MRCSSSSPSWALAGPRLFPLPAPHALLPLRKTRLLLLQPTWLHLPLLLLACPWLPRSSVPLPLPLNTTAVVDLGAMPESEQRALLARFLEAQAAR